MLPKNDPRSSSLSLASELFGLCLEGISSVDVIYFQSHYVFRPRYPIMYLDHDIQKLHIS